MQDAIWIITGPAEGSTVSGEIAIVGTATHPNFESYRVLYAAGPRPTGDSAVGFSNSAEGVKNMVINGTLATWDTTAVPNGEYTLALALYEVGNTEPKLHFTNNITVFNEEVTPTPEPTPTPLKLRHHARRYIGAYRSADHRATTDCNTTTNANISPQK